MKKLTLLTILLLGLAAESSAQDPFQLFITSYEKKQAFNLCKGKQAMVELPVNYAYYNLSKPYKPLTVESVKWLCDTNDFEILEDGTKPFEVGLVTSTLVGYWPKSVGTDTLKIVAYYGPYSSTGTIICHAVESPPIAFYGGSIVWENVAGDFRIGSSSEVLTADTLHDMFSGPKFYVSDTAMNPHSYNNNTITIKACGTRTIDSIYTVGDFSDIELQNIPALPYTMNSGDTLEMKYVFTPRTVGKTPHYLVVHTTDGDNIVWSFEYEVIAKQGVNDEGVATGNVSIYPNPATEKINVTFSEMLTEMAVLEIFDESGRLIVRHSITNNVQLDVSNVASGAYTLVIRTSKKTETKRFVVAR